MINKVVSGVCTALYNSFGDKYTIYKEVIKQGLQEPCFLVECYDPRRKQMLNDRYYRQMAIAVHYFPKSKNNYRSECNEVLEKLYTTLELITIDGDLTRGQNFNKEFSDDIMIVFVDYDFYTFETPKDKNDNSKDLMKELKQIHKSEVI